MLAGSTDLAMSISEVHIIIPRTWCMCSQMAFACRFLIVSGLRFMTYDLHNVLKCNFNSNLLSYIKYWHLQLLHNQILLSNQLIWLDDLSKISSLLTFSLLLTDLVVSQLTSGNSTILNQLEAGAIMVSIMKPTADPAKPLRVYGPTKSTHKVSQGVLITIFTGRWPNFSVRLSLTWHDVHDFVMDWMVTLIPF